MHMPVECLCVMQDRETILLPHPRRSPQLLKLSIVRVLEFSSQTLRSGAVVLSDDAPAGCALLFLRGAPAVIRSLVRPASVPRNFDQVGGLCLLFLLGPAVTL